MLTEARADGDKAKVEQLLRNAVTMLKQGLGVDEVVVEETPVTKTEVDF